MKMKRMTFLLGMTKEIPQGTPEDHFTELYEVEAQSQTEGYINAITHALQNRAYILTICNLVSWSYAEPPISTII